MPKCTKVKNPCKICLGPVTQKNGLKCQGVCQNWVHYGCLNYTPGRISDIKRGVIKVTCPCPDCKTTCPKEYRTDAPYSCDNSMCPANRMPKCENEECPTNKICVRTPETPCSRPCPLSVCGKECKQHSSPRLHEGPIPQYQPPCAVPTSNKCPICQASHSPTNYSQNNSSYSQMVPVGSISDTILEMQAYPSGCTNTSSDIPGDVGIAYTGFDNHMTSLSVFEQMCNAVGQLTMQLNDLMGKMKQMVIEKNFEGCIPQQPGTNCAQRGPRSLCPKPCYCTGKPFSRK